MSTFARRALAAAAAALAVSAAHAIPETRTSPTGGALPAAVTEVGGIVLDLTGVNGTRLVAQLAASTLFSGNMPSNPILTIGTQTGFLASSIADLGGAFSAVSVRVTLFDGDQAAGDFDFNDNFFRLDGVEIGNWSNVLTYQTNASGTTQIGAANLGFNNNQLRTGFFTSTDASFLSSLATNLADGSLVYSLRDADSPGDQFFDFTQGVDGGLINVGTPPVVVPPVNPIPEPETYALMGAGLAALGFVSRRRKQQKAAAK
jgi:hypothetical protein